MSPNCTKSQELIPMTRNGAARVLIRRDLRLALIHPGHASQKEANPDSSGSHR